MQMQATKMILPEKGDIIRFRRSAGYSHFAIYIGDGLVIHRSSDSISSNKYEKCTIRIDKLTVVAGGVEKHFEIANYLDDIMECVHDVKASIRLYDPDEIVDRAKSKLGEKGYNLFTQNCEHFVTWCRYGIEKSEQVEVFKIALAQWIEKSEQVEAFKKSTGEMIALAQWIEKSEQVEAFKKSTREMIAVAQWIEKSEQVEAFKKSTGEMIAVAQWIEKSEQVETFKNFITESTGQVIAAISSILT